MIFYHIKSFNVLLNYQNHLHLQTLETDFCVNYTKTKTQLRINQPRIILVGIFKVVVLIQIV